MSNLISSVIAGVGSYLPDRIVTNDELAQSLDTSHDWIFSRTGIVQRYIAAKDQLTSDLAYHASVEALRAAGFIVQFTLPHSSTENSFNFAGKTARNEDRIGQSNEDRIDQSDDEVRKTQDKIKDKISYDGDDETEESEGRSRRNEDRIGQSDNRIGQNCDKIRHSDDRIEENEGKIGQDIECIILATSTPDNTFPATAAKLQSMLGASKAFVFDLQAVCAGFIFALTTADMYIRQGFVKNALVVGAETFSRIVDWQDRKTAVLFGDGAGAVLLKAQTERRGLIASVLQANGAGYNSLCTTGGPSSSQYVGTIKMDGQTVYRNAIVEFEKSARDVLAKSKLDIQQIDWFIPHQANKRIIDSVAQKLQLADSKVIHTTHLHANTSAASIPLALHHALKSGKIKRGDLVLLSGFGAGFSWGSSVIEI